MVTRSEFEMLKRIQTYCKQRAAGYAKAASGGNYLAAKAQGKFTRWEACLEKVLEEIELERKRKDEEAAISS